MPDPLYNLSKLLNNEWSIILMLRAWLRRYECNQQNLHLHGHIWVDIPPPPLHPVQPHCARMSADAHIRTCSACTRLERQTMSPTLFCNCRKLSRVQIYYPGQKKKKKRPLRICIKSEHCSYHAISAWSAWSGDWHGGAASRDFGHRCTPKLDFSISHDRNSVLILCII